MVAAVVVVASAVARLPNDDVNRNCVTVFHLDNVDEGGDVPARMEQRNAQVGSTTAWWQQKSLQIGGKHQNNGITKPHVLCPSDASPQRQASSASLYGQGSHSTLHDIQFLDEAGGGTVQRL